MKNKNEWRQELRQRRQQIPETRRLKAAKALKEKILKRLPEHPFVLSYASFGDELDTRPLNSILALEGRLLLPRVNGSQLEFFFVTDLNTQLRPHPFGFDEPVPKLCKPLKLEEISVVLVPALGFDENHHRLGYGKGFYDRLLKNLPNNTLTIGIAYQEQKITTLLPIDPHDVCVGEVLFF